MKKISYTRDLSKCEVWSDSHFGRPRVYVFCHGFGFDVSFWDALKPYFNDKITFYCDLGYFGEAQFPEQISPEKFDYVGIGHSLGFMKLLSLQIPWVSLIGLHGFVNFLGYDAALNAKRTREWRGLYAQLKRSPKATLQDFYQRAGVAFSPSWEAMNEARLLADLTLLTTSITPQFQSILWLGARDDVIVPPVVLEDNVKTHPHIRLYYVNSAKHGLEHLLPDVILDFLHNL